MTFNSSLLENMRVTKKSFYLLENWIFEIVLR